jgi:peroxiredoxin
MASTLESQIESAEKNWLASWQQGPSRIRWSKLPLQVGDRAPDFDLQDSSGSTVRLRDFWKDKPVLLLFWRHYGCSCGIDRARRLNDEYAGYTELGANVVIIGQGEPERAAAYARQYSVPCPMLSDPTRKVYEAYDILEGKPSQVVFDAADDLLRKKFESGAALQASRHGTVRASVDSPWQLPGEFVVDKAGVVRLAYRYQYCEDWPNPLVLIAGIKEALWENA